jgi:Mg2+ and Co2+ transporter CorA
MMMIQMSTPNVVVSVNPPQLRRKPVFMSPSMKAELEAEVEARHREQAKIDQHILEELQRQGTAQQALLDSERQKMEQERLERHENGQMRKSSEKHLERVPTLQKKLEQIRKYLFSKRKVANGS